MLYSQNYEKWNNDAIGNEEGTLGSNGGLVTALTNVYNQKYRQDKKPNDILHEISLVSGMSKDGYICIEVARKIISSDRIDFNYTGIIDYDFNNYFIITFLDAGQLHFSNLIEKLDNDFFVFDVFDEKNKMIRTHQITRAIKIYFELKGVKKWQMEA